MAATVRSNVDFDLNSRLLVRNNTGSFISFFLLSFLFFSFLFFSFLFLSPFLSFAHMYACICIYIRTYIFIHAPLALPTAKLGGGISYSQNSAFLLPAYSLVEGNKARSGGAFFIDGSEFIRLVQGTLIVSSNRAQRGSAFATTNLLPYSDASYKVSGE